MLPTTHLQLLCCYSKLSMYYSVTESLLENNARRKSRVTKTPHCYILSAFLKVLLALNLSFTTPARMYQYRCNRDVMTYADSQ